MDERGTGHRVRRRMRLRGASVVPIVAVGVLVAGGGSALAATSSTPAGTGSAGGHAAVRAASSVPSVSGLNVDPKEVTGGQSAVLTVTLGGPAPAGGAVVTLYNGGGKGITDITAVGCSSSNGCTTPPPSTTLVVPAGATTADYVVTTEPVTQQTPFLLSARTSNSGGGVFTGGPYAIFTVDPGPARAITGTVKAATFKDLTNAVVAACADPRCETVVRAAAIPFGAGRTTAKYSLAGLPKGRFYVTAFTDTNKDLSPDCSIWGCNDLTTFYTTAPDATPTRVKAPATKVDLTLPF